jgi:hypothetical protein
MTFLNSISREAGSGYRFAALMKRHELDAYPKNRPLGAKFSMMKMAKEISDAGKDTTAENNTLDKSLYKTNVPKINRAATSELSTQTQHDVYANQDILEHTSMECYKVQRGNPTG